MLDPSSQERARQEMQKAEESRWQGRGSFDRTVAELRGRRFIDNQKDTQFTDAWIILGVVLTIAGLVARNGFLSGRRGRAVCRPADRRVVEPASRFTASNTRASCPKRAPSSARRSN